MGEGAVYLSLMELLQSFLCLALTFSAGVWSSVNIISAFDAVIESGLILLYWHCICKGG